MTTKTKAVDLGKLSEVGAHFGYSKAKRHPTAKPYILGAKGTKEIFDIEKIVPLWETALAFVEELGSKNAPVLFVGGKSEAREAIRKAGETLSMPYVAGRWIGGTLTNFGNIRKRVQKLLDLKEAKKKGELAKYTKKERLLIDREIENLEEMFSGIVPLEGMPKAMIVIDSDFEKIAVEEAHRNHVPVVALVGSDCNFSSIEYPVAANDASKHTIAYFMEKITEAYQAGAKSVSKK